MPARIVSDERFAEVAQLLVAFCDEHLDSDYRGYCVELAEELRDDHPKLITAGRAMTAAAGIIYTAARDNSLFDGSFDPHITAPDLAQKLGVSQATAGQRSNEIMRALGTKPEPPIVRMLEAGFADVHSSSFAKVVGPARSGAAPAAFDDLLDMLTQAVDQVGPPSRARNMRPEVVSELRRLQDETGPNRRVVGGPPAPSTLEAIHVGPEWTGLWHITDMSLWEESYFNAVRKAFVGIVDDGSGLFCFGEVEAEIDGKVVEYQEFTRFEFTFVGVDGMHPVFGSGWMQQADEGGFVGQLRLHAEYGSTFTARKHSSEWDGDSTVLGEWDAEDAADAMDAAALMDVAPPGVYQIKVTLRSIRPPIWRRVLLLDNTPLDELHTIIQSVMGWHGGHLHQFVADDVVFEMRGQDDHFDFGLGMFQESRPETGVPLSSVLSTVGSKMRYEYDFGDGWEHDVLLEKVLPIEDGAQYPVCIKGKRACPPEDCGGPWGYRQLLETLADPNDSDHEDMLDWLGGPVDPEEFDLDHVNTLLERPTERGPTR